MLGPNRLQLHRLGQRLAGLRRSQQPIVHRHPIGRSRVLRLQMVGRTAVASALLLVALAADRRQRRAPELEAREQLVVGHAVGAIAGGVHERIDHAGRPGQHGAGNVQQRIAVLFVGHIDQHQRQEAGQKAQEDDQHHGGEAGVLALATAMGRRHGGGGLLLHVFEVLLELAPLPADRPVDARVRADDDDARQEEADEEEELLDGAAVLSKDRARERGGVQAELAPDAEQRWELDGRDAVNGFRQGLKVQMLKYHDAEREEPDEGQLAGNAERPIDAIVVAVVCDQDVAARLDGIERMNILYLILYLCIAYRFSVMQTMLSNENATFE